MKKINLIFLIILIFIPCLLECEESNVKFSDFFADKTMRLDYFHFGTFSQENFSTDRILSDGPWSSSKTILIDRLQLGLYQFEIREMKSNTLLYSRGYCSIFGEWQTIPEAKKMYKTFHESIRFPWPKKTIKVVIKKRNKINNFEKIWETIIDPDSRQVNPADRLNNYQIYNFLINGPADKKVDIVILGDGYQRKEMDKFKSDVKRLSNILLETQPYKSRKGDFNIRAIKTPSLVSGVSKPHSGIFKRTPLSVHYSSFDSERYALSYDNRTIRNIASLVPYDFLIIFINEATYGGGGIYQLYATLSVDNKFSGYIIIHEMGHHVGALADEYYSSSISYEVNNRVTVEPWELNVTALLDKDNLKWKDLIKKKTPIPTPWGKEEFDKFSIKIQRERTKLRKAKALEKDLEKLFLYQWEKEQDMFSKMKHKDCVGAFEGAAYLSKGLYRSFIDCIMFTRNLKFCPVCQRILNMVFDQYTR